MRQGNPVPVEVTKRHSQLAASESIKDMYDALRELVTNSDDSYHRLGKQGGRIIIEVDRHRSAASVVRVRDRAEGMTLHEMEDKIRTVGVRTSGTGDRGFFARGARDCAVLGDMIFESIKHDHYHKAEFTKNWDFIPWYADGKKKASPAATEEDRQRLGIRKTGTVVTIETRTSVPLLQTFEKQLPLFWPLRDILDESSSTEVYITDGGQRSFDPQRVCYRMPEAELVVDTTYPVPGYEGVEASLKIYRASEPLVDQGDRFRKSGIIVKASRGVHECSFLLARELENDPLAKRYLGRLECAYIDDVCEEYDAVREAGGHHPPTNPTLLVDPQRQRGLAPSHPFTKALFEYPTTRLRGLVAADRKDLNKGTGAIGGDELQRRLRELAKVAERFLQDEAEPEDILTDEEDVQDDVFRTGVLLVPTYANIREGQQRNLTLYVAKKLPVSTDTEFSVTSDNDSVEPVDRVIHLRQHKKRNDVLIGTVVLRGNALADGVLANVSTPGLPAAEALVRVVPDVLEDRDFVDKLEFDHRSYKVREGRRKTIRVYAQYPELVAGETPLVVTSSLPEDLVVRGTAHLVPVEGTNFAVAEVVVEARRQIARPAVLTATANDNSCTVSVRVVQDEREGAPLRISIVDRKLYGFRAQWADSEGTPNVLQISALHPSVRRYLGSSPDYPGQDTPLCRLLIAEIVAEAICRRTLRYQTVSRSWEFDWARSQDNEEIADSVMVHFNKLMEGFLPAAHSVMLSDREVHKHLEREATLPAAQGQSGLF